MMPFVVGALAVAVVVLGLVWSRTRAAARRHLQELAAVTAQLERCQREVARLAAALSGAGDGLIVLDEGNRVVATNPAAQELAALPPLAAIQGLVETLLDDPAMPQPTRQRFLERVARQAERLTTLVADLLTLSRLDDDGGIRREDEPCDFAAVLRETVRDLLPLAEK